MNNCLNFWLFNFEDWEETSIIYVGKKLTLMGYFIKNRNVRKVCKYNKLYYGNKKVFEIYTLITKNLIE